MTVYTRLRNNVTPHADLLANSTSLIATSAVTSLFGFVYWWVAARNASPTAVGTAGAAVSAMTFVGTIGAAGLGTLLISELPSMNRDRWRLISACVLVAGGVGLAGGLIFVIAMRPFVSGLTAPLFAAVVVLGTAATAALLVLDEGLVGLLAGGVQLVRNAWFAAGKLALLAACALTPIVVTATGIVGVWVAAAALSVVAVAVSVRRRGLAGSRKPDFGRLRSVRGRAMDHNRLNLALFLPRSVLPLIVALVVSPQANAGFYAAWMVVSVLAMIPSHFATALFAVARDPDALRSKVRVALVASVAIGLPVSLLIAVERDRILATFGSGYVALGAAPLGILALTYLPTVVRQLYIAVSRATGRVRRATRVALGAGAVEVAAAAIAGAGGGLTWLAVALAVVFTAEALVMAPAVVRVIRSRR